MKASLAFVLAIFTCSLVSGEELPDEEALAEWLDNPSRIEFLAGFAPTLEELEVGQFPELRKMLDARAAPGKAPPMHLSEALKLLDATWVERFPRAALDAACAREAAPSLDAQSIALQAVLREDVETAIAYYLKSPVFDSFSHHCYFYDQLSRIDPARAVRLYFESPDKERAFLNPLSITFTAWAKRDLDTAWAEAGRIGDEEKRDDIRREIAGRVFKTNPAKFEELLATISEPRERDTMRLIVGIRPAPGQHSPAPPPKDEAAGAREDLELEQILKGGYDAYMAGKDTDRKMMEQLFARFPERAWLWLRDMSASDTYAENRYRDLAEHWPADKFASDVPRMLRGDAKERAFGLALGRQWLRSDPEAAIPYLFSRHQNLGNTWRDALPFHIFIYQKKWDRELILAFMDKIEDPVWRDLVRRETVLYFILNDPGPEGLKSLLALEKPEDIDRVIGRFVRYRIRGDGHVQFLDGVIALGPEHAGIRERMLELMPAALVDADDGDKSLIPKIVEAIRDPVARVRALEGSPAYRIPATIGERILLILAGCPAGKSRDEQINSAIERIPVADRVAILEKTDNPMLRARILARLPNAGQFEEREFRICIAALESLPPEWKDEDLADKWMMDQATRDPSKWGQALNRHLARKKDTGLLYSTMDRWVKSNPQAALQAIYESGPQSATSGWIVPALLAIHQNDNQAVLRHLRSRPEATRRALTEHFSQWARTSPSAACAASLLVMPDDLRLKIFHSSFQTWVAKQPDDAMRWSKGLPTGRERLGAIHNLATYLDGKGLAPPEWLKSEVPERFEKREPPPRRTPEEFAEEGRKFRAAEESRLARQRTAASIRALALLDENEVIVKVKDLPDGPQKVDSLFGLLEHAAASGNANLREQVAKQLAATDGVPSTEIATTVMNHLPLEDLDAAIGFEREIADPKARETCSSILLHRWSEPKHRDRITRWIREYPMVDRRLALADTYIRGMLRPRQDASGRTPPASASPELDALLRESITAWARLELAHALLDHRAPHPLSLGHSGLDADVIRETRAAIERQQSEKRYQSAPSQP